MAYVNYFLNSKASKLTQGHLKADQLYEHILGHNGNTAYCCYFDLDEAYLKLEWDTGILDRDGKTIYEYHLSGQNPKNPAYTCNGKSFTKYEGIAKAALGCVSFDFDDEDEPANAMEDVKKFIEWLDIKDAAVFFSGSKGFHLMVPSSYFPLTPNEHLPNQLKDLAKHLKQFYPTLDDSIYNYNRKFRAPFSQHEKTGLYKTYVDIDYLFRCDIDDIVEMAADRIVVDFLDDIKIGAKRGPLHVIIAALEQAERKSYEIEKDRAGTVDLPSPFEKFDDKLCIKKMLESRCDEGRNNACMRLVNDYYRTGKTQNKCETDIFKWSQDNGLAMSEVSTIISNIYERGGNYNFGCQDEVKSIYCSAKCSIWKKLDPDKRPITVDMPQSALAEANSAKQPKEFEVVKKILMGTFGCDWDDKYKKFENGFMCCQGEKDLFFYKEGYWQHLDADQIKMIKIKFNAIFEQVLTTRRIDQIFKMFMMYVPTKPNDIDMFVPRSNVANFANGTLHLKTNKRGEFSFEFLRHEKSDYITFKIDYDYDETFLEKNDKFEDWLMEYLMNDQEQFNLVQEMFGASLVPTFPQLFMLVGLASTGKSTCMKVLKKMHGDDIKRNLCGVAPHNFNGFDLESMIGKLVNIVMDIKTNCKIDDDIVKQVEDRDEIRIRRKNREDIYTPLPALHIFGANKMPATLEGYSGAMTRRWSIIHFNKEHRGKKNRNISNVLFDTNPQGVVNFAVRGLFRVALENQGFFSKSDKSIESVTKWGADDDLIQLFLNDACDEGIDSGEFNKLAIGEEYKISKAKIWDIFKVWQEEASNRNDQIGRNQFYKLLEVKGYKSKRFTDTTYILGFGELILPPKDHI